MKIEKSPFRKIWDSKLICKIEVKYPEALSQSVISILVEKDRLLERFSPTRNDLVYNKEKRTRGVKGTLYYIWVRFSLKKITKKIKPHSLIILAWYVSTFFLSCRKPVNPIPDFFYKRCVVLFYVKTSMNELYGFKSRYLRWKPRFLRVNPSTASFLNVTFIYMPLIHYVLNVFVTVFIYLFTAWKLMN